MSAADTRRLPALAMTCLAFLGAAGPAPCETLVDATAAYDPGNPFARILRGEVAADIVFENEHALAFRDIRPQAKVHVLIVPKGAYTNILQFNATASPAEKLALLDAISETARIMRVDESGFRIASNTGRDAGQTVPHLHIHLLGGEPVHGRNSEAAVDSVQEP